MNDGQGKGQEFHVADLTFKVLPTQFEVNGCGNDTVRLILDFSQSVDQRAAQKQALLDKLKQAMAEVEQKVKVD